VGQRNEGVNRGASVAHVPKFAGRSRLAHKSHKSTLHALLYHDVYLSGTYFEERTLLEPLATVGEAARISIVHKHSVISLAA
jgi:hypothetical protein